MTESIRDIISASIIVTEFGPICISTDLTLVNDIKAKLKARNIKIIERIITTNYDRLSQFASLLFESDLPDEAFKTPILFRNKVITEWQKHKDKLSEFVRVDDALTWQKITKKYNITVDHEIFSQALIEYNSFINA